MSLVIVYCYKDKKGKHNFIKDLSSNGLLLRCTKCGMHIVNLKTNNKKRRKND